MTPANAKPVRDLLTFYVESGVDVALDEAPANRFADQAVPPAVAEEPVPAPATRPRLELSPRDDGSPTGCGAGCSAAATRRGHHGGACRCPSCALARGAA